MLVTSQGIYFGFFNMRVQVLVSLLYPKKKKVSKVVLCCMSVIG